ncbi:uncharacterized protein Triagg1_7640 [Trichoderma aggressivum f. europaeum]|uniref:Uncharacterized protein n=1 Tax=Trichoderma aggressivum f. europaeum TaxID=173218 RepID=A0AAE1J252_9HYPO|nr:hypothetical protein Triagg1_7640 [Trichoderma aggressivum f. europaeum]
MVAPSRYLLAIGQWEEYCNIQMGPPAKTSTWRAIKGVNPFESHQPCCPAQVICRSRTMVRSCQKQKLSALPGSPIPVSNEKAHRHPVRLGDAWLTKLSYRSTRLPVGAFISYFCSILGFPDLGKCVREPNMGNEAILCLFESPNRTASQTGVEYETEPKRSNKHLQSHVTEESHYAS